MNLGNLKQLVKEELRRALKESMFKVGEEVMYGGKPHKVVSDDGYIIKLEATKDNKEATLNYAQAKQKIRKQTDYMNENDSSEFDIDKIYKAKSEEPRFLEDLELGATYEVEYGARDQYGDKDTGTTKVSVTQKDLNKYGRDTSIQNYLTSLFNINPKTGENIDIGYEINNIKSVKKL
jgi:hypothetical protein